MKSEYSLKYLGSGKDSQGSNCAVVEVKREGIGEQITVIPFSGASQATPVKPVIDALSKLRYPVMTPARKAEVLADCQAIVDHGGKSDRQAIVADQPGWLPNFQYITPDGKLYGKSTLPVGIAIFDIAATHRWVPVGKLSAWKSDALKFGAGNPAIVFSCASALSGPLLELRKLEGVVFSFLGKSSTGKSNSLRFASSVIGGDAHKKSGFAASWASTEAGVEVLAREGRDSMVLLDDTLLVAARGKKKGEVLVDMIFNLISGIEKRRKSSPTSAAAHRLMVWSSSNTSLRKLVEDAGIEYGEMFDVRHIEIPVEWTHGIFETLPKGVTAKAFVKQLSDAAQKNYGVSFRRYMTRLANWQQRKPETLKAFLDSREKEVLKALGIKGDEQVSGRVADYFALVYMAGCLGKKFGATPWGRKTVLAAVVDCWGRYQQHMAGSAVEGPANQLRQYILSNKDQFLKTGSKSIPSSALDRARCLGFIQNGSNGEPREYILLKDKLAQIVGSEDRLTWLVNDLKRKGWLITDKGKSYPKRNLAKGWRPRVMCIKPSIASE